MEPGEEQADIQLSTPNKVLTGVLVAVMVVVGIYPHHLIELSRAAAQLLN
jgi:NADH:ubiquinone oxidoreductase subunit 4 (subunit M)